MRLRIIVHGKQADNAALRRAVVAARMAGHDVDVRVTWEPGDATVLAEEAVRAGVGTVAAAGGDGTLHEVVQGLLAGAPDVTAPSLGLIPIGTANDFARAADVPLDPDDAVGLLLAAPAVPIDAGRCGDRVFLNMATGGFGTEVTVATPEELKGAIGPLAYLLTGATRFTSITAQRADLAGDGFTWSGRFLALAVGNGRQAGGGVPLCPGALVDDGLLDVAVVPAPAAEGAAGLLATLLANGVAGFWTGAVAARVRWLAIVSDSTMNLNLDGEPLTASTFRIEVIPSALRMHLPAQSPLRRVTRGSAAAGHASAR